jgi:hypothetical protein
VTDRESVYVEALSLASASPPNWWFEVDLGDRVIHSDGWYDDCEAALAAGREWAEAKGYDVLPIRIDEEE